MATERPLYVDSSALVKLIVAEPQSPGLYGVVRRRELVSSELVLAEVPRAIWRLGRRKVLSDALENVLRPIALVPVVREVLVLAGALEAPFLRTPDAIHIASALTVADEVAAFVTYDQRQGEAAHRAGFEVLAPD